jgi:hypothetical protein
LGSVQWHKNQNLLVQENLQFQTFVLSFDALLERRKNFNEQQKEDFKAFINEWNKIILCNFISFIFHISKMGSPKNRGSARFQKS